MTISVEIDPHTESMLRECAKGTNDPLEVYAANVMAEGLKSRHYMLLMGEFALMRSLVDGVQYGGNRDALMADAIAKTYEEREEKQL